MLERRALRTERTGGSSWDRTSARIRPQSGGPNLPEEARRRGSRSGQSRHLPAGQVMFDEPGDSRTVGNSSGPKTIPRYFALKNRHVRAPAKVRAPVVRLRDVR